MSLLSSSSNDRQWMEQEAESYIFISEKIITIRFNLEGSYDHNKSSWTSRTEEWGNWYILWTVAERMDKYNRTDYWLVCGDLSKWFGKKIIWTEPKANIMGPFSKQLSNNNRHNLMHSSTVNN